MTQRKRKREVGQSGGIPAAGFPKTSLLAFILWPNNSKRVMSHVMQQQ